MVRTFGTASEQAGASPGIPGLFGINFRNNLTQGTLVSSIGPTLSFTRATASTTLDFEGIIRSILSGETRFHKLRRVQNYVLGSSNDLTSANWGDDLSGTGSAPTTTANAGIAPDGTMTASRLQTSVGAGTSSNDRSGRQANSIVLAGGVANHVQSVWLKSNTGVDQKISVMPSVTVSDRGNVTVTSQWQRFSSRGTAGSLRNRIAQMGDWKTADTADILVWGVMSEDVVGQANTNPSELVSKNVLSTPFHGAGVDAVKYFNYANGNTVASNLVTENSGAGLTLTAAGISVFVASTERLLQNNDLTNAAWSKGATATVAKDQTGPDGIANSASSFTGGAVTATNIVTQNFTLASSARYQYAWIKRITGSGVIEMTTDGGTSWVNVTGQISGAWALVTIPVQTVTNPTGGLRITVNGDKIAVAYMSNRSETGAAVISTAGSQVTTNADAITAASGSTVSQTEGTLYVKFLGPADLSSTSNYFGISDNTANERSGINSNGGSLRFLVVDGGVTQASIGTDVPAAGAVTKIAARYRLNDFAKSYNGNAVETDVSGTLPTTTQFDVGLSAGGGSQANTVIQEIVYSPIGATDARLSQATS